MEPEEGLSSRQTPNHLQCDDETPTNYYDDPVLLLLAGGANRRADREKKRGRHKYLRSLHGNGKRKKKVAAKKKVEKVAADKKKKKVAKKKKTKTKGTAKKTAPVVTCSKGCAEPAVFYPAINKALCVPCFQNTVCLHDSQCRCYLATGDNTQCPLHKHLSSLQAGSQVLGDGCSFCTARCAFCRCQPTRACCAPHTQVNVRGFRFACEEPRGLAPTIKFESLAPPIMGALLVLYRSLPDDFFTRKKKGRQRILRDSARRACVHVDLERGSEAALVEAVFLFFQKKEKTTPAKIAEAAKIFIRDGGKLKMASYFSSSW